MGVKKTSKKKTTKAGKVVSAVGSMLGTKGKGGGGKRRHHGVAYYQNQVLKEKLKKRLMKLKYGGR